MNDIPANEPKNILDAVMRSVSNEKNFIANGAEAKIFKLEGYDNLIIRVTDESAISSTTDITKANQLYDGANLGQEAFKGNGFTINYKQDGVSPRKVIANLIDGHKANNSAYPEMSGMADFWKKMSDLPKESYENFLSDMNKATKDGRIIDPNNCNYLIDFEQNPPRIGWVDLDEQGTRSHTNSLDNARATILSSTTAHTNFINDQQEFTFERDAHMGNKDAISIQEKMQNSKNIIKEKLNEAAQTTGTPLKAADIDDYVKTHGAKNTALYDDTSVKISANENIKTIDSHIGKGSGLAIKGHSNLSRAVDAYAKVNMLYNAVDAYREGDMVKATEYAAGLATSIGVDIAQDQGMKFISSKLPQILENVSPAAAKKIMPLMAGGGSKAFGPFVALVVAAAEVLPDEFSNKMDALKKLSEGDTKGLTQNQLQSTVNLLRVVDNVLMVTDIAQETAKMINELTDVKVSHPTLDKENAIHAKNKIEGKAKNEAFINDRAENFDKQNQELADKLSYKGTKHNNDAHTKAQPEKKQPEKDISEIAKVYASANLKLDGLKGSKTHMESDSQHHNHFIKSSIATYAHNDVKKTMDEAEKRHNDKPSPTKGR